MKGGKNFWAEGDVAFLCYYITCLKNPHEYFTKITERPSEFAYTLDKNFDIGNASAVDENQAKRAFFDSVKSVLKLTTDPVSGENWFEKYAGLDLRESFGDLKGKIIEFPARKEGMGSIRLMSFNSTASAPEGLHFIRFYEDELSRADTKAKFIQADKVHDLASSNTRASFPNRVAKVIAWSYPNESDYDLTHNLYEQGLKNESVYAIRLTTFQFNPAITKEMLADAYKADIVKAQRIYECVKPVSKNNFYQPYVFKLREAIAPNLPNRVSYKQVHITRISDSGKEYTFTSIEILGIEGDKKERCFTYDASKVKDRFTIYGGYNETIDPLRMDLFIGDQIEVITTNKKPVVDIMIVIEPKDGYPVDYLAVGDIFTQLFRAFPNAQTANSDHYQNEKLRQELIAAGLEAETYFFSNEKQIRLYTKKRWMVWNNNLTVCNDLNPGHTVKAGGKEISPTELWVMEGERLFKDGNKIDHPQDLSKDAQDGVAILVNDLMELEAKGVVAVASTLEDMTDEKFRELVHRFMDEKEKLLEADTPEELINTLIAEKLLIKIPDAQKLSIYVKENYGY